MMERIKMIAVICSGLAFFLCLAGGVWILMHAGLKEDPVSAGMGLYFMGKAFFVGPMLLLVALKCA